MKMSVKTVDGLMIRLDTSPATVQTQRYHRRRRLEVVDAFLKNVDAAIVYANISTAFTDGRSSPYRDRHQHTEVHACADGCAN